MSEWAEPDRCAICGLTDKRELRFALVHWIESEPGMAYEHVAACRDRDACRARVAANGELWPLVETMRKSAWSLRLDLVIMCRDASRLAAPPRETAK